MKEVDDILKEIKKEEENILKKGKNSPDFEKVYKDISFRGFQRR